MNTAIDDLWAGGMCSWHM